MLYTVYTYIFIYIYVYYPPTYAVNDHKFYSALLFYLQTMKHPLP